MGRKNLEKFNEVISVIKFAVVLSPELPKSSWLSRTKGLVMGVLCGQLFLTSTCQRPLKRVVSVRSELRVVRFYCHFVAVYIPNAACLSRV